VTVTVTVKVVLFAISNELHGVCHTVVKIQAVTMKTMMFLLPLVMVMTVVLVAAAAAVTTTTTLMIVYMLVLMTIELSTSSNSREKCHCKLLFHTHANFSTGTIHSKRPGCMVVVGWVGENHSFAYTMGCILLNYAASNVLMRVIYIFNVFPKYWNLATCSNVLSALFIL
jgi:hypothetical protein